VANQQSNEQRLEGKNQVIDVLKGLNESWENRFTLDNPRLVENYLEGELQFLVLIKERGEPGNEFVAFFERALPKWSVRNNVVGESGATQIDIGWNLDALSFGKVSEDRPLERKRQADVSQAANKRIRGNGACRCC
jgi:hypothetical protein